MEKTLNAFRAVEGPDASDTVRVEVALGRAYDAQGDLAHAEQIWELALQRYRRLGSYEEINAAEVSELLGQNLTRQHKYGQAEALLCPALGIREKGDRDAWGHFRAPAFLGACLAGERRYAEAEPLLLDGYQGMLARKELIPAHTDMTWTAPENRLSSSIRHGASRKKPPSGRKNEIRRVEHPPECYKFAEAESLSRLVGDPQSAGLNRHGEPAERGGETICGGWGGKGTD